MSSQTFVTARITECGTRSGRKVVTSENYLALTQSAKKAKQVKPSQQP